MAITIEQEPVLISPAYNDIVYVISSDNTTETNFKYVADIVVKGKSFRITLFPHPSLSSTFVNVGRIIENYLSSDIGDGIYGFQECNKSYEEYTVRFGEQYGDPVVVYPNLTSDTKYAWNGVIDFLPYQSYTGANYIMVQMDITPFLTNQPSDITIRDSEDAWLYGITNTSGTINYAQLFWNAHVCSKANHNAVFGFAC